MDMASRKPDVLCSLQIIGFLFTKKIEGKLCSRNLNTSLRLMENGLNLQSVLKRFCDFEYMVDLDRAYN